MEFTWGGVTGRLCLGCASDLIGFVQWTDFARGGARIERGSFSNL